jgi:hypothetical protein
MRHRRDGDDLFQLSRKATTGLTMAARLAGM